MQSDRLETAAPRRWAHSGALFALLIWLVARVAVTAVAIAAHLGQSDSEAFFGRSDWFFRLFFSWDSSYFHGIAAAGYFGESSNPVWMAFFPGYPVTASAVSWFMGGEAGLLVAMWLVAFVGSAVAAVLVWMLAESALGSRGAFAATILFVAGPYSVFLVASYSEGLFLAFAVGAWLLARRGQWLAAGLLVACASFTRANGLFLAVAVAVVFVIAQRERARPFILRTTALMAIGVSGALSYFIYLYTRTGDPLAWSHAQTEGWDRTLQWPWLTFYETAGRVLFASTLDRRIQFGLDIVFAALLVTCVVVFLRRRQWAEAALTGLTAVTLMTSFTYMSIARNSLTVFPIVVLVASALASARYRWIFWVTCLFGVALFFFNARQFTFGLWAD